MATITVPAETPRKQVVVGGTPQTSFTFDFVIYDVTTDIRLFNGATELTIGSDFTVSGNAGTDGGFDGGTVTMAGSFSSGLANVTVTILSKIAIKRTSNLASTGPLDIDLLNKDLNRTVSMLQKFEERQDRMPALEEETSITLPITFPAPSANGIISWNNAATGLESPLSTGDIATATTKAGEAAASAAAALNSKNAAATSATASAASATAANTDGAAQVTLATAQVGLATTQANNAAAQVALAAAEVVLATAEKTAAVAAKDAAVIAKTASETAKTASEAAQVAAAASATSATSSANAAEAAAAAIYFEYETSTSMANPSAGGVRFNNASMGSVTQITFSATSASTGNPDVSDYIVRWDDSTSPVKGHIIIRESGAPGSSIVFAVSGSITDNTTHLIVPVSHITSAGVSLSAGDDLYFSFTRTGDAGNLSDPMTTRGDIIFRNSSNAIDRLAVGSANRVLVSDGTDLSYGQVPLATAVSGVLPLANGGTNANTAAAARTQLGLGTAAVSASTSFEAVDADILRADTIDELAVGYSGATTDAGVKTSGTFTPSPDTSGGGMLHYTNGGAHTLGVPSKNCNLVILMKNNVSAGAVTVSSFTISDGDPLTTVNNHEFFLYITRYSDGTTTFSSLTVKALQ